MDKITQNEFNRKQELSIKLQMWNASKSIKNKPKKKKKRKRK